MQSGQRDATATITGIPAAQLDLQAAINGIAKNTFRVFELLESRKVDLATVERTAQELGKISELLNWRSLEQTCREIREEAAVAERLELLGVQVRAQRRG